MDDPGAVWDSLLASARQRANTPASAGSLTPRRRLALRAGATPEHLPNRPRRLDGIPPELRAAIRAAVAGESPWPLVVCGPPGTGKTCAALCLLDHAGGRYWTAAGLCGELVAAQQGRLQFPDGAPAYEADVWRWCAKAPLVVLDELGTREKVSDFAFDAVKRAIDDRYGLPLVCLSNHPLDVLATLYDDRIADRLAEGTVIELRGESRRVRRAGP